MTFGRKPLPRFAMVAANIWNNKKIRRAGPTATMVFIYALTKNAESDRSGSFPASELDPWFVADQLHIDEDDAQEAIDKCEMVGLLSIKDGVARIVGWDDTWSRQRTAAEDRKDRRHRKRERERADGEEDPEGDEETDTEENQNRVDRSRLDDDRSPDEYVRSGDRSHDGVIDLSIRSSPAKRANRRTPLEAAKEAFDGYFSRTHDGAKPRWSDDRINEMAELLESHGITEIVRRLQILEEYPPAFPPTPWDMRTFSERFDAVATPSEAAVFASYAAATAVSPPALGPVTEDESARLTVELNQPPLDPSDAIEVAPGSPEWMRDIANRNVKSLGRVG